HHTDRLDLVHLAAPDLVDVDRRHIEPGTGRGANHPVVRTGHPDQLVAILLHVVAEVAHAPDQAGYGVGDLDAAVIDGVDILPHVGVHLRFAAEPAEIGEHRIGLAPRRSCRAVEGIAGSLEAVLVPHAIVGEWRHRSVAEVERIVIAHADVDQPPARIGVRLGHLAQQGRAHRAQVVELRLAEVAGDDMLGLDDPSVLALQADTDERRLAVYFHHRHQPDLLRNRVGHRDTEFGHAAGGVAPKPFILAYPLQVLDR